MTKKLIKQKLDQINNGSVGWIGDIKVAKAHWLEYCYMIIEPEETAKDIQNDDFTPIISCRLQKPFIDQLYKYLNKGN